MPMASGRSYAGSAAIAVRGPPSSSTCRKPIQSLTSSPTVSACGPTEPPARAAPRVPSFRPREREEMPLADSAKRRELYAAYRYARKRMGADALDRNAFDTAMRAATAQYTAADGTIDGGDLRKAFERVCAEVPQ